MAYGSTQKGVASPTADGLHSQHPDSVPFANLADQQRPTHQRPDSAQSMPAGTRNGAPKDQWMLPKDQQGIGGPRDGGIGGPAARRQGPVTGDGSHGQGGPYGLGAPSTRLTPGLGPATNGTTNFGPEYPSSGRSSGE